MDEVLNKCVLFEMGIAMLRTPMPQTHGSGKAFQDESESNDKNFLWSKHKC